VSEPRLFADRGCPFAHRVLALADHLGIALDQRESIVGDKPKELTAYSESLRIPLMVHGDLVITESLVMLEYLSELHGFSAAYPEGLVARTRHRHAMAVMDQTLTPLLFRDAAPEAARVSDTVRALEAATAGTRAEPCLLGFHVAPIWLRLRWWQPQGAIVRAIEARRDLCRWLDTTTSFEAVVRTAPDRAEHTADLEYARATGLV
jgi:glutathione S-transferase